MLDPRGNETRGSMSAGTDFINDTVIDNRPAEYFQTIHKKNTVKELLMMRRQKCSDNILEHKFKSPKSEVFPSDLSPHLFDPPTPVHFSNMDQSPPENGHITQQQMQHPMYPTAEVKLTLFHWQIQRETQRMEGVSQEKLNMQDGDGDTILHIAVAKGRRALAYVLATQMSRCGSLDVKEHNGQTALQIAAATNQHLIVHDLLEHGAQINTRDLWGRSPLHVCAEKGHLLSLQSIWKTLMRTGQPIDIEMFNYEGLTALHAAVMSHNAVVKELRTLENPCSYMTMELGQRRQMHFECIKILLHMGACFGTKDLKSGHTCLHMASEEANVELLNLFLDQSSSLSFINVKTFSGNTALHIVSSLQNHKTQVEAVRLLMRNGADPGTRNFENELPCHLVPGGPVGDKVRRVLKGKYVHA